MTFCELEVARNSTKMLLTQASCDQSENDFRSFAQCSGVFAKIPSGGRELICECALALNIPYATSLDSNRGVVTGSC